MARSVKLSEKSMPQAASHIDEKTISLLHRWLVKKNNPHLSKKLERKWAPSRELIKRLLRFLPPLGKPQKLTLVEAERG